MLYPEKITPFRAAILIVSQCQNGGKDQYTLPGSDKITDYPVQYSAALESICEAIDNKILPWEEEPDLPYPLIWGDGFKAIHNRTDIVIAKADLKKWLEDYHPELRPAFLFGADDPQNPLPLNPSERKTVAKLIFTMAVDCYGYDPTQKKSPIPTEIMEAAANVDLAITEDTIRKWLKEGASLRTPH
jgi:hypothetical protein